MSCRWAGAVKPLKVTSAKLFTGWLIERSIISSSAHIRQRSNNAIWPCELFGNHWPKPASSSPHSVSPLPSTFFSHLNLWVPSFKSRSFCKFKMDFLVQSIFSFLWWASPLLIFASLLFFFLGEGAGWVAQVSGYLSVCLSICAIFGCRESVQNV